MANTVIALKKSATPAATPVSLSNGELAINFADGKLFYKNATGQIVSITSSTNSFGTVNANNTLVVADSPGSIFSLVSGDNITIAGDAINDKITISLNNDVVFGVNTQANTARDHANAAFASANAGQATANVGLARSNTLFITANSAWDKANTANITADRAWNHANAAFLTANIAFANANTVMISAQAAFTVANSGFIHANSSYGAANLAWSQANSAFAQANLVFNTANTGAIAYGAANIAWAQANSAYTKANSINVFTALTDVPSTYANSAGYLVTVNPGGTGLQFSQDISLDELIHSARVAPTVVANDTVTVYVTASGTTPNREVAYKIKNEFGEEVIISSILT